jgi:hypothetical protein
MTASHNISTDFWGSPRHLFLNSPELNDLTYSHTLDVDILSSPRHETTIEVWYSTPPAQLEMSVVDVSRFSQKCPRLFPWSN